MPREFYADTNQGIGVKPDPTKFCLKEIEMFDGPAICMRPKGHKVDDDLNPSTADPSGEFHQEAFEGWVWDNHGRIG